MSKPATSVLRSRILWQLYGAFGITILLASLLLGLLTSAQVQQDARKQLYSSLFAQASILSHLFMPYLRIGTPMEATTFADLAMDLASRVTVIDHQGRVLADNRESAHLMDNHAQRPEIAQARLTGVGESERFSETLGQNLLYVAVRVDAEDSLLGYVRVAVPITSVQDQMALLRNKILVSALVITALSLILGFFVARAFTRPIAEITAMSARIARGEYNLRLPSLRKDEIGELASAFNDIAQATEDKIEALTRSRDQIAAVLSGLSEGVIAVDTRQRIVHINAAARQMLKLQGHEVDNMVLWEVIRISEICQAVDASLRDSMTVNRTLKLDSRVLELAVVLMRNQETQVPSGAIIVLGDVTDMLRLQRIRTDFVANASHELKTPISAIRGYAETIIDDPVMPEETRQHFMERVRSQAARLDNIVQDLIHLSRFDGMARLQAEASIDLGELLLEVFQTKSDDARDAGVQMAIDLPSDAVVIAGERGALEQLVSNLLDNAIKYSKQDDGRVMLRLSRTPDTAVIDIEDNGMGIAEEEQQRIFERFYRVDRARSRDKGGTGLGLAIVKHIAQSHRGSVSVVSQPGEGALFRVSLPLVVVRS